jgi:hypothetical protein
VCCCVAVLTHEVYKEKPKLIKTQTLPLLWSLLGQSASASSATGVGGQSGAGANTVRGATAVLACSLYKLMGEELFQQAKTTTSVTPRMLNTLQDMVAAA